MTVVPFIAQIYEKKQCEDDFRNHKKSNDTQFYNYLHIISYTIATTKLTFATVIFFMIK